MLALVMEFLELFSFVLLSLAVWRIGKKPGWKIHAVLIGWALFIFWSALWSLPPVWFKAIGDIPAFRATFLESSVVPLFLLLGWIYPLIIVILTSSFGWGNRRKNSPKN